MSGDLLRSRVFRLEGRLLHRHRHLGRSLRARRLVHRPRVGLRLADVALRLDHHQRRTDRDLVADLARPADLARVEARAADDDVTLLVNNAGINGYGPFAEADPALLVDDTVEIPVQIRGKVRSVVTVPADADADAMEAAARADEKIAAALQGQEVKRVIAVPGRLINFVV